jgi:hypothetical protein
MEVLPDARVGACPCGTCTFDLAPDYEQYAHGRRSPVQCSSAPLLADLRLVMSNRPSTSLGTTPTGVMRTSPNRSAQSVWLIVCMSVATGILRLSIMLADTLVLWRVYGRTRVATEHLRITRTKPDLVVSNGDILHGVAFEHYLLGAGIWLLASLVVLTLIYRSLVPPALQHLLERTRENAPGAVGILCALCLFVLVVVLLPLSAALLVALFSSALALSWAWRARVET